MLDSTQEVIMYLDKEKEPWALSTGTSCIKLTGDFEVKQYEEVEIVYYLHYNGIVDDDKRYYDDIKLTGVIKREVKPKVKHRKQIFNIDAFTSSRPIPHNARFFAEWEG